MTEPYPEDIATSISNLVSNKERRKELGANAKKMIETIFNWNHLISQYIEMYKLVKDNNA